MGQVPGEPARGVWPGPYLPIEGVLRGTVTAPLARDKAIRLGQVRIFPIERKLFLQGNQLVSGVLCIKKII